DWESLASGPFAEIESGPNVQARSAPAKNILGENYECKISVTRRHYDYVVFSTDVQFMDYRCERPMAKTDGEDPLAAVKVFAAPWNSSFSGWWKRASSIGSPPDRLA